MSDSFRIKDRRIGNVTVSAHIINDTPDVIHDMFLEFIPIMAEHSFIDGLVHYTGISPQFDIVSDGQITPEYTAIMTTDGGATVFSHFERFTP